MTVGFALATLLLNTPAAIVLFFVYRWVIPIVLFTMSGAVEAFAEVSPYLNFLEAQGPLSDLPSTRARSGPTCSSPARSGSACRSASGSADPARRGEVSETAALRDQAQSLVEGYVANRQTTH